MRRSTRKFSAAQKNAFEQTEAHLDVLAGQYDRVVRAAGVRAATKFSEQALTAAAGDPPWVVPPLDDLVDVTRVTQELLTSTEATRTAAAQSATRPILSAMGVSFSLEAPMVKDLVGRTGKRAAALAVPGLQDAVREAITTGFAEGLSVPQTAALIAEKSNGLAAYQSEMLARTDLVGTANGGSTLAAKAVWPEGNLRKRWLATTDQHTRETHVMADGQVVALDDRFLVGDDMLLFPGDPMGSDEEVCNCRCTVVYIEDRSDVTATAWDQPGEAPTDDVDELIAASWDSAADGERAVPDGGYGDGVTVAADPNDWSVTAAGWEGESLPDVLADGGPDVTNLAMIAVYPRTEEQDDLALPNGQEAPKLHTTLVFLGDATAFNMDEAAAVLATVASNHDPLEGSVGGTGHFAEGPDGRPLIALPSVRGLAELRDDIVDALAARGIFSPSEHGWTPHITLAYVGEDDPPETTEVVGLPLHFDSVSFVVADERFDIPLRREEQVAVIEEEPVGAHAVAAVMGMLGEKWSEMVAALTSLGSRPVVVEMPRELTAALGERQDIVINVPEQPPAQITVEQPAITVEAPNVTVEPAQITVETPAVTVEVAAAEVNVPPAEVTVVVETPTPPDRRITFHRNPGTGRIESAEVEDEAG